MKVDDSFYQHAEINNLGLPIDNGEFKQRVILYYIIATDDNTISFNEWFNFIKY